jgi:hypothetical protein
MSRVLSLLCLITLCSCATATTGTREAIIVNSSPAGADANLTCNGQPSGFGVTPTTITIRRNAGDCVLKVSKAGFEELTIPIEQGINPAYWQNMIFSPLAPAGAFVAFGGSNQDKLTGLGMIGVTAAAISTDFITGAVHAHKPNKIDAVLKPKG